MDASCCRLLRQRTAASAQPSAQGRRTCKQCGKQAARDDVQCSVELPRCLCWQTRFDAIVDWMRYRMIETPLPLATQII
eukprot:13111354-Alexandrium_andersonii.AAC.1